MNVLVAYEETYRFYRSVIAKAIEDHRPHMQVWSQLRVPEREQRSLGRAPCGAYRDWGGVPRWGLREDSQSSVGEGVERPG
jgi:hypothetical protein